MADDVTVLPESPSALNDTERVERWRYDEALHLGFSQQQAEMISHLSGSECDLHKLSAVTLACISEFGRDAGLLIAFSIMV